MGKFSLTWDSYSTHVRQLMGDLINDVETADVTLVCSDEVKIQAHKIVLKACSSVFKTILQENFNKNTFIYLRGVPSSEMKLLMEYMYLGETSFRQEQMEIFLEAARDLKIKEINDLKKEVEQTDREEWEEKILNYKFTETTDTDMADEWKHQTTDTAVSESEPTCTTNKVNMENSLDENDHKTKDINTKHQCDQCSYATRNKNHLKTHTQYKHEGVRFDCMKCEYKATTKNSLKMHTEARHEGKKFDCNSCNFTTIWRNKYVQHIKKHKSDELLVNTEFVPESCENEPIDPPAAISNEEHDSSNAKLEEETKYECNECDYVTANKYHLKTHIQYKHEGLRFPCLSCDYKATTKSSLKMHMGAKHEGKNYSCDQCSYKTTWRNNFNEHIKTH